MMSTYEMVVALFAANSSGSTSTTEVTTIQTKKVLLTEVDAEANAANEAEI
jgi:hypothetical protein